MQRLEISNGRACPVAGRLGFTLVELLVVIVVVAAVSLQIASAGAVEELLGTLLAFVRSKVKHHFGPRQPISP